MQDARWSLRRVNHELYPLLNAVQVVDYAWTTVWEHMQLFTQRVDYLQCWVGNAEASETPTTAAGGS